MQLRRGIRREGRSGVPLDTGRGRDMAGNSGSDFDFAFEVENAFAFELGAVAAQAAEDFAAAG
jgi:hypothetical protein